MKSIRLTLALSAAIFCGALVVYWSTPEPGVRPAERGQSREAVPLASAPEEGGKKSPGSRPGAATASVSGVGARSTASFLPSPGEAPAGKWALPAHGSPTPGAAVPSGGAGVGAAPAAAGSISAPVDPARDHVDYLVPVGAILPAAMMEPPEDELTPPQARARDLLAREFLREVPPLPAPGSPRNASDYLTREQAAAWTAAREKADQQYRILFGEAALNARNMAAAREALAEK